MAIRTNNTADLGAAYLSGGAWVVSTGRNVVLKNSKIICGQASTLIKTLNTLLLFYFILQYSVFLLYHLLSRLWSTTRDPTSETENPPDLDRVFFIF